MAKKGPKHEEHNAHGSARKPFGGRESKAELLARMKKAQGSASQSDLDQPSDPADDTATDAAGGKAIRGSENLPD